MADIDIVPKRRGGNLELWIVIAIVVVAVLWVAIGRHGRTARVGLLKRASPVATAEAVAPGAFALG